MDDQEILVANTKTGEMFPVNSYIVEATIYRMKADTHKDIYWSNRLKTIYDLLMAGF